MDGNGRWARAKGLERSAGHLAGVDSVRRITRAASDMGVKYLTLYAFSTENWKRPAVEVEMLMHLIATAIANETPELLANNVRIKVIGDMDSLPDEARDKLNASINATAACTGMTLVLAISYSARWEIVRAAKALAAQAAAGTIDAASITDRDLINNMATADIPDPDLLIRTGGEMRISNYLLWQIAYTELYFTPVHWPDFDVNDLVEAFKHYNHRQRRYGLTGDQVTGEKQ